VGINLLREGLDVPEVSLVAILDADKEGFLRSERSLVQTIGRAARNSEGKVIMYADKVTDSMQRAMDETSRRRSIQEQYNEEHGIVPKTIIKEIRDLISISKVADDTESYDATSFDELSKSERKELIAKMEDEMREAAKTLDFETAATLRDTILELKAAE
jgi:excinuclease ABC subunit B